MIIRTTFNDLRDLDEKELIEKQGKGWNRIIGTIKDYPLKFGQMPEVKGNSRVVVTLFSAEEMPGKEPRKIDIKAVNEWLTKVDARLTQELSDKEKEIVLFMLKNKKISSADCKKLLSISREMANRYFTRLIERKLIVKMGAGKYTHYVLISNGSSKSHDTVNDTVNGDVNWHQ